MTTAFPEKIYTEYTSPSKTSPATIILKGEPLIKEAIGSLEIKPGQRVQLGKEGKLVSDTHGAKAFAIEKDLSGKSIDDSYAMGEVVRYAVFHSGQEVHVLIGSEKNNESYKISIGDVIGFDMEGKGMKVANGGKPYGIALEDVNNSLDSASDRLLKMEVL